MLSGIDLSPLVSGCAANFYTINFQNFNDCDIDKKGGTVPTCGEDSNTLVFFFLLLLICLYN